MNFPSKRYTDWHKNAKHAIQSHTIATESFLPFTRVSDCKLTFYAPTKRKYDLTNRGESIMDLLVDCEIIEDDNWSIVPRVELIHGGVDRENPRCEIELHV